MSPDRHIAPIYEDRTFQGPLYRSPSHTQQGTLYRSTSGWSHITHLTKPRTQVKDSCEARDEAHIGGRVQQDTLKPVNPLN